MQSLSIDIPEKRFQPHRCSISGVFRNKQLIPDKKETSPYNNGKLFNKLL
jgi:hypothetical protein